MPFEHVEGDDKPLTFLQRLGCILAIGIYGWGFLAFFLILLGVMYFE